MASYNNPNGGKKSFSNNPYNNLSNNSQSAANSKTSSNSNPYNVQKIFSPNSSSANSYYKNRSSISVGKIALIGLVILTIICIFKMCSTKNEENNDLILPSSSSDTQSVVMNEDKYLEKLSFTQPDPDIYDLAFEEKDENWESTLNIVTPGTVSITLTDIYAESSFSMYLYDEYGNEISKDYFSLDGNNYGYAYDLEIGTYTLKVEWSNGTPTCKLSIYFGNEVQDITEISDYGMLSDSISAPYMTNVYILTVADENGYYFSAKTTDKGYNSFEVEIKDEFDYCVDHFCTPYGETENYLVNLSPGTYTVEVIDTYQAADYTLIIEKEIGE